MLRNLVWLALLPACAGDDATTDTGEPGTTDTAPDTMPSGPEGPGAFDPDFETSADFFTRMAAPVDGASVHGTVQIWYSTNAQELIEAGGSFTAPVGTVAIKVQDNGSESITVMVKKDPGFDPANGDWSYEQRGIDGSLTNEGALQFCIDCHSGWPDTDYLAGTDLQ